MKIALIIHGNMQIDNTRKITYVETIKNQIMSIKTYIRNFGEETYNEELAEALELREKRDDGWSR